MDIGSISATISSLKTAGDIAKSMIELKSISDVQGKVIDLQSQILSAQSSALSANSEQFSMIEEIRSLKEEITSIKAWEGEKDRYKLTAPWDGTVTYALKESMCNSEPPHWICTNCYEKGRKSILTQQQKGNSFIEFYCPEKSCQVTFLAPGRHRAGYPIKYV